MRDTLIILIVSAIIASSANASLLADFGGTGTDLQTNGATITTTFSNTLDSATALNSFTVNSVANPVSEAYSVSAAPGVGGTGFIDFAVTNGFIEDVFVSNINNETGIFVTAFSGGVAVNTTWTILESFSGHASGLQASFNVATGEISGGIQSDSNNSSDGFFVSPNASGIDQVRIEFIRSTSGLLEATISTTVIPEPSSLALISGLIVASAVLRRRRVLKAN